VYAKSALIELVRRSDSLEPSRLEWMQLVPHQRAEVGGRDDAHPLAEGLMDARTTAESSKMAVAGDIFWWKEAVYNPGAGFFSGVWVAQGVEVRGVAEYSHQGRC